MDSHLLTLEGSHKLVPYVMTEILRKEFDAASALAGSPTVFSPVRITDIPSLEQKREWVSRPRNRGTPVMEKEFHRLEILTAVQWAEGVWRAWYLALTARRRPDHAMEDDPASSVMRKLAEGYLLNEKFAVKYVKEQTTWLTAKALGQLDEELPIVHNFDGSELPLRERGILGGGWVYSRCRTMIRFALNETQTVKTMQHHIGHALDVLMSKLGRPPVTGSFVKGTMDGYKTDMTDIGNRFKTATTQSLKDGFVLRERLKVRIQEICHHMFKGRRFVTRDCIPSLNATFETNRAWGGCLGGLMESWAAERFGTDNKPLQIRASLRTKYGISGPIWSTDNIEAIDSQETVVPVVVSEPGSGVKRKVSVPVKGLDYLQDFQAFIDLRVLGTVEEGKIHVKPFGIKEPDKVRVITMEEEAISYRCLEIQKFLHPIVKSYAPFTFIGKPIDEGGWDLHFGGKVLKEDELYQSGDYEGATNNINPILCEHTWDCICSEVEAPAGPDLPAGVETDEEVMPGSGKLLSTVWWKVGRMDLTGHIFHFGAEAANQVWGQLMGSPTSFPILCIINLAASSLGLGMTVEEIFAEDCPILVNGDDLAAICRRSRYPIWARYVSAAGLKPSLGKNYLSPYFLIMNSECRVVRIVEYGPRTIDGVPALRLPTWKLVGFLNQSLLRGFEKKGIDAGKDLKPTMGWWQLGARARELVEGVSKSVAKRWLKMFVLYHHEVLEQVPAGVSWTASEALGGVGLPDPEDREIPERELKFHAFVACLDESKRAKLLRYPKLVQKSWMDEALADSEKYYSDFFPSHYEERDRMDLVLENWGFPVTREKSDLGSSLRLAFVLDRWVQKWTRFTVGQRTSCWMKEGTRNRTANSCEEIGTGTPNKRFFQQVFVLRQNLMRACRKAQSTSVHIMTQQKARTWAPPTELVIDWSEILTLSAIRFGSPCLHKGRKGLTFNYERPQSMLARLAATRLGLSLEHPPIKETEDVGSWEIEDLDREDGSLLGLVGDDQSASSVVATPSAKPGETDYLWPGAIRCHYKVDLFKGLHAETEQLCRTWGGEREGLFEGVDPRTSRFGFQIPLHDTI